MAKKVSKSKGQTKNDPLFFRMVQSIFFPNIFTLMTILAILPVSSADTDRSFSAMKRLKTVS